MGEIRVSIAALIDSPDKTESHLYLKEVEGNRVMILRFDPQLYAYMEIARRGEQADGCDYLHGRFIHILKDRYDTVIEKLTLSAEMQSDNEMVVVTLIHFKSAGGSYAERFTVSDAFGLAAYCNCPIYIAESIFNRAAQTARPRSPNVKKDIDDATDAAKSSLDKLPKA